MANFRVFHRVGPGDAFQVIESRIPGDETMPLHEQFRDALQVAVDRRSTDLLKPGAATGQYLVQNLHSYEARLYNVAVEPVIKEL